MSGRALALVLVASVVVGCGTGASSPAAATPSATGGQVSGSPAMSSPTSSLPSPSPSHLASPEASSMPSVGPFTLTSTAFREGGPIPVESTCHGRDVSPELSWSDPPAGTTALVLFVDDPDGHDWVHWSVLDIAASTTHLPSGVPPTAATPQQGRNDFGKVGYGGPCPPSGTHHYRFTLTALAAPLGLADHPDGRAVRQALAGAQVLGAVTLTGTFRA